MKHVSLTIFWDEKMLLSKCWKKRTPLIEELLAVLPLHGDPPRDLPQQLNDVREMILIPRVARAPVRLEQVVARRKLKRLGNMEEKI